MAKEDAGLMGPLPKRGTHIDSLRELIEISVGRQRQKLHKVVIRDDFGNSVKFSLSLQSVGGYCTNYAHSRQLMPGPLPDPEIVVVSYDEPYFHKLSSTGSVQL